MYLGIDLGTSSVKMLLLSPDSSVLGESRSPLTVQRPKMLYSEQNPEDWWQATKQAILQLSPKLRKGVTHIGLTGQMHGAVLLDRESKSLRPAMLWDDGRAVCECAEIAKQVPDHQAITANLIMPGFTAPKVLWVKKHEPAIFQKTARVLLPKDYLRYLLTGTFATDMSDASGTSWLNISKRSWSPKMLSACGLSEKQMPELFEGPDLTGTLLPNVANALGLSKKALVIAGGSDNATSGLSVGCLFEGTAFLSLGTSGVLFTAKDTAQSLPQEGIHTYCHAVPGKWHQMSVHLSSASCFSFLEKIFSTSIDALLEEATTPTDHSTIFLPYLSGERTPHNDPYAKGVFFGLSNKTTRGDLVQSVMEGTAFACKNGQDALLRAGAKMGVIHLLGGGVKSRSWLNVIASVLQKPLYIHKQAHFGAAYGAAKLARFSALGGSLEEAFPQGSSYEALRPNQKHQTYYQKKEALFNALYPALKDLFSERRIEGWTKET